MLYLEALYHEIMKHCEKDDKRYRWFEQAMIDFSRESSYMPKADETYKSVGGAGALNIKALNVLKELCTDYFNRNQ